MRLSWLFFSSLLFLSGASLGEPKTPTKPSATEQAAYKKALKEGRALHLKKKYQEAIEAFQEALKAIPNDPRALSELGYAAYFAKDYPLALSSTQKSIEAAKDPKLKAASLYNLGLIYEATGKKTEAADAYVDSLKLRDNKTVLKALSSLDPARATSYLGLVPKPLGAYASREAACDEIVSTDSISADDPKDEDFKNALDDCLKKTFYKTAKPPAPYLSIEVTEVYNPGTAWLSPYRFLFKTKDGFFASEPFYESIASGVGAAHLKRWESEDTPFKMESKHIGTSDLLLIRYQASEEYNDVDEGVWRESEDSWLLVCGVGGSNMPSCLEPIRLSSVGAEYRVNRDGEAEDDPTREWDWKIEASFSKDGKLVMTSSEKKLEYSAARFLGEHAIVFP